MFDFNLIIIGFVAAVIFEVVVLKFLENFLFYVVVREGTCKVFVLFGEVAMTITEPGLHFLWPKLTWKAIAIGILGKVYTLDLRLDQRYLRTQTVNSEEGAPMGVGVWYESMVADPISYLFKNSDPQGSLAANVSNATVRCLSNLPLTQLLEERRSLSQTVRTEVTPKSLEWGYRLGSVYIRKVHFRDENMIREIEGKVVNRLRQVTAAIKQDGDNQVHLIMNKSQQVASIEFAKAAALRPQMIGKALGEVSSDPEVSKALFDFLETQKISDNPGELILVPRGSDTLKALIASQVV
jgi:regulator of protease activity HflC (stomatin/prohibitin superfamily)